MTVQDVLAGFDQYWHRCVFDQWVRRHNKCNDLGGDYIEKNWTSTPNCDVNIVQPTEWRYGDLPGMRYPLCMSIMYRFVAVKFVT